MLTSSCGLYKKQGIQSDALNFFFELSLNLKGPFTAAHHRLGFA
jgi:hypothetical protein